MAKFRRLDYPFANLSEARSGCVGAGLTAAEMNDYRLMKPTLVGRIEYIECTLEKLVSSRPESTIETQEVKHATQSVIGPVHAPR
jgi:hypothetical protein